MSYTKDPFEESACRNHWRFYYAFAPFDIVNDIIESDFHHISSFMFQFFCDTEVDHCRDWNVKRQERGEPSYVSNM